MKIDRTGIWTRICEFCQVSQEKYLLGSAVIGWPEFVKYLNLGIRGTRKALDPAALWLAKPRSKSNLLFAAIPPDEFAILHTSLRDVFEFRDEKESPDLWIVMPEQLAMMRSAGGPIWQRFVDLSKRFPQLEGVPDGELGLDLPTKARFFPVCLDTGWLDRRMHLRELITSVKRSNSIKSRWGTSYPI